MVVEGCDLAGMMIVQISPTMLQVPHLSFDAAFEGRSMRASIWSVNCDALEWERCVAD